MKSFFFTLLIAVGLTTLSYSQNLVFVNLQSNSTTPKIEIRNGKTMLFQTVGAEMKLTNTWNEVPKLVSSEDRSDRYSGLFVSDDRVANRKYEIVYHREHGSNRYLAYLKTTIDFKDSRPTKVLDHQFKLQGQ